MSTGQSGRKEKKKKKKKKKTTQNKTDTLCSLSMALKWELNTYRFDIWIFSFVKLLSGFSRNH